LLKLHKRQQKRQHPRTIDPNQLLDHISESSRFQKMVSKKRSAEEII